MPEDAAIRAAGISGSQQILNSRSFAQQRNTIKETATYLKRLIIRQVDYFIRGLQLKVRAVIKLVEEDGWFLDRTRGSHRQYRHYFKRGLVTISGNLDDEVPRGTLNSILKQSGLKEIEKDD